MIYLRRYAVGAFMAITCTNKSGHSFVSNAQAIDGHSHLLAPECCYHCPAGSLQFQHGPSLQLAEMESHHSAHEEERCTLTTRALQWSKQEPIDNADGLKPIIITFIRRCELL